LERGIRGRIQIGGESGNKARIMDLTRERGDKSEIDLEDEDTLLLSPVPEHKEGAGTTGVSQHSGLIPCSKLWGGRCPTLASSSALEYKGTRESPVYGSDLDSDEGGMITTIRCPLPNVPLRVAAPPQISMEFVSPTYTYTKNEAKNSGNEEHGTPRGATNERTTV